MMGKTHFAFGLLIALLLYKFSSFPITIITGIFLITGALFPDIDHGTSFFGKKTKLFSMIFKHRGFIHSVFMLMIMDLLIWFIKPDIYCIAAFTIGFLSHMALDFLNPSGLKPFFIGRKIKGNLRAGEWPDVVLFSCFLFIIIFLILF